MSTSRNWLLLFLRLEVNIIIFITLLWKGVGESRVKYFIINSFSSFLLVYSIIRNINVIRITILLFKLALPPFISWGVDIINWIGSTELIVFLTVQKIGLIILLVNFNIIWLVGLLVVGSVLIVINSSSVISILFVSSLVHRVWIIVRRFQSLILLTLYFIVYSILLLILLNLTFESIKITVKFEFAIIMLVLRGLPPFLVFYFKWLILSYLISLSIVLLIVLLIASLGIIIVYFRMFYINILIDYLLLPANSVKYLIVISLVSIILLV